MSTNGLGRRVARAFNPTPRDKFLRAFTKNLAACDWEPHPEFSVFAKQWDRSFYLSQRKEFLHKYKCFWAVSLILGAGLTKNASVFPSNNQQFGIWNAAAGGTWTIENNYMAGNGTGPIGNFTRASLDSTHRVRNNRGLVTEKSGSATVPSGSTSVAVTHGLSITPNGEDIRLTPIGLSTNNVRHCVSATSSTTFTVLLSGDPGASGFLFGWSVEVV